MSETKNSSNAATTNAATKVASAVAEAMAPSLAAIQVSQTTHDQKLDDLTRMVLLLTERLDLLQQLKVPTKSATKKAPLKTTELNTSDEKSTDGDSSATSIPTLERKTTGSDSKEPSGTKKPNAWVFYKARVKEGTYTFTTAVIDEAKAADPTIKNYIYNPDAPVTKKKKGEMTNVQFIDKVASYVWKCKKPEHAAFLARVATDHAAQNVAGSPATDGEQLEFDTTE